MVIVAFSVQVAFLKTLYTNNFYYRMLIIKLSTLVLLSLVSSSEIDERLINDILTEAKNEVARSFLSERIEVEVIPGHCRRGATIE